LSRYDPKRQVITQVPLVEKRMYRELRLPSRFNRSHGAIKDPAVIYWYKYAEKAYRQLEAHLTEVWRARGVDWDKVMSK
jgi:hypothetical protein